jgi:hypothetical protein
VIDPGNSIFKAKGLLFISTLLLGLWYCAKHKLFFNKNILLVCLFFGLFLPLYGFFVGKTQNYAFDISFAFMYVKSFLFIWLLMIQRASIPFAKHLSIASLFVIVPSLYFIIIISAFDPNETYYFVQHNAVFISRRMFAGFIVDPVIYYKTLSLSVFGIGWLLATLRENPSFHQKIFKIILLVATLIVVVNSFSRAIWISTTVLLLHHFYIKWKHKKVPRRIFAILLLVLLFVALPVVLQKVIFAPGEEANAIKYAHVLSYIDLFAAHPLVLLIGQGLGGGFYSGGFGEITYMTELGYLELIRFFGVPLFCIIVWLLFYPLFFYLRNRAYIAHKDKFVYLSYGLYLFCIGTNPLLINSTGMIVLVVVYSITFKNFVYEKS